MDAGQSAWLAAAAVCDPRIGPHDDARHLSPPVRVNAEYSHEPTPVIEISFTGMAISTWEPCVESYSASM